MDECAYNLDKCEDKCINTPGGYRCTCPYGQVLASNGHSCIKCAEHKSEIDFSQISTIMPTNITNSLWHVAICKDNSTICSGSLINDNFIITTANCICKDNSTTPEMVSVMMNKNYGCSFKESDAVEHSVSKIICHPFFKPATSENNIALLKLAITMNAFSPLCLPAIEDTNTFSVNKFAAIYDYGQLSNISISNSENDSLDDNIDMLHFQVTQIVAKNRCGANYNQSVSSTDHILCTGESGMVLRVIALN